MTPEERNTVIEALKLGLENTRLSQSEPILRALAIMRREGEPVAEVLADGDCFRLAKHLPAGTRLYKD